METFAQLAAFLSQIGLGGLFSVTPDGSPSGWLWTQMQEGVRSEEELLMKLETTPEFRNRFQVIFDMRDRANRGENVVVPTASDVLKYESAYMQVMAAANVPSSFYDSFEDAQNAIRRNLTIDQIQDRIDVSYGLVRDMPVEVRDAFEQFYGDSSDGALVAAVLDPEKALSTLDRQARAAQIAGFGRQQRVQISQTQAEEFAGMTSARTRGEAAQGTQQAREAAARVAELTPLAETQVGESALTAEADAAFRAGALGDVGAQRELENRLLTRRTGQSQTAGGALAGQTGIIGA